MTIIARASIVLALFGIASMLLNCLPAVAR